MAIESTEPTKIRLKDNLPSGTYGIGRVSLTIEAGEVQTVGRHEARLLVANGSFEYAEDAAMTPESLNKLTKDELTEMAIETGGASEYVGRLKKDELIDYLLKPLEREARLSQMETDLRLASALETTISTDVSSAGDEGAAAGAVTDAVAGSTAKATASPTKKSTKESK